MNETKVPKFFLPAWETDFADYVATAINFYGNGLDAEVVIGGDGAVRVTFPSGGERTIYVDDWPHGERFRSQTAEVELLKAEVVEARDEADSESLRADSLSAELDNARDVIREARALLDEIRGRDEAMEEAGAVPGWLSRSLGQLDSVLAQVEDIQ
jgi:hypothetical protein